MTRKEHEQCVKVVINHWRNRYLAVEKQLKEARGIRSRSMDRRRVKAFGPAKRARLQKKQQDYIRTADKFQRFLCGFISARRMCELIGFPEDKNTLAPILLQLQTAHDELVDRGFKDRLELILCGIQAGAINRKDARRLLGMDARTACSLLLGESE